MQGGEAELAVDVQSEEGVDSCVAEIADAWERWVGIEWCGWTHGFRVWQLDAWCMRMSRKGREKGTSACMHSLIETKTYRQRGRQGGRLPLEGGRHGQR